MTNHRLVAEVWRRPRAPLAASYLKVAEWGHLRLYARISLGVVDRRYNYIWVVRRLDGTVFERRRIHSFLLDPDPKRVRKSDRAGDWPCSAKYVLRHRAAELDDCINDSSLIRNPTSLNWEARDDS